MEFQPCMHYIHSTSNRASTIHNSNLNEDLAKYSFLLALPVLTLIHMRIFVNNKLRMQAIGSKPMKLENSQQLITSWSLSSLNRDYIRHHHIAFLYFETSLVTPIVFKIISKKVRKLNEPKKNNLSDIHRPPFDLWAKSQIPSINWILKESIEVNEQSTVFDCAHITCELLACNLNHIFQLNDSVSSSVDVMISFINKLDWRKNPSALGINIKYQVINCISTLIRICSCHK